MSWRRLKSILLVLALLGGRFAAGEEAGAPPDDEAALGAAADKLFEDIKSNAGKGYALDWRAGGTVEQGGTLKLMLPAGWTLGKPAANGDSAAAPILPPADLHVLAYLGRSVQKDGIVAHYRQWFSTMLRGNRLLMGKGGPLVLAGRTWQVQTYSLVANDAAGGPLARRVMLIAVYPLNADGTEWRSLIVMCTAGEAASAHVAEVVRGILEKTEFGEIPKPKD